MSLPHFYLESQVLAHETEEVFPLKLAADDAKHARVLRLGFGEHMAIVDAAHDYFECEIVALSEGVLHVRIAQHWGAETQGATVVLVQGLAKGDKMETVIRHATELGVAGFLPLLCERSIVKLDAKKSTQKGERWRGIAKSAAMQSGQRRVPEVSEPQTLQAVCEIVSQATALLICWEDAPQTARISGAIVNGLKWHSLSSHTAHIVVVVGPEGGLTRREVDTLLACNPCASLVSLGPSILRTETAGIVAPALVLYELTNMQDTTPLRDEI